MLAAIPLIIVFLIAFNRFANREQEKVFTEVETEIVCSKLEAQMNKEIEEMERRKREKAFWEKFNL